MGKLPTPTQISNLSHHAPMVVYTAQDGSVRALFFTWGEGGPAAPAKFTLKQRGGHWFLAESFRLITPTEVSMAAADAGNSDEAARWKSLALRLVGGEG